MAENPYSAPPTTDSKYRDRRLPLILFAIAVALLAVVVILATMMWYMLGPTRPPDRNPQQATPIEPQELGG